jgi:hypothetical protein
MVNGVLVPPAVPVNGKPVNMGVWLKFTFTPYGPAALVSVNVTGARVPTWAVTVICWYGAPELILGEDG